MHAHIDVVHAYCHYVQSLKTCCQRYMQFVCTWMHALTCMHVQFSHNQPELIAICINVHTMLSFSVTVANYTILTAAACPPNGL